MPVNRNCRATIVIPSYNEPELGKTLGSLKKCTATGSVFEVIVVLNCAESEEDINAFHLRTIRELANDFDDYSHLELHFINAPFLQKKQAGVGLARKIGMDEAARRFEELNYDGLIVCLDADCKVSENYLAELEKYANNSSSYNSICLNFEHRYNEVENMQLRNGIIFYELFLRYYKEALKWCGFPFHYHTIGSSMAVKTSAYCKSGGMNKRKAGEDFYFLHKVFPYGKVVELNIATVYPSARISHRVPFGTGRAQQNFIERNEESYSAYNFKIFEDLKEFLSQDIYSETVIENCALPLREFLLQNNFHSKIEEIKNNTSDKQQFYKRFFNWFDGFMVLKYVHFVRNNYYPNVPIEEASSKLLERLGISLRSNEAIIILEELKKLQLGFLKNTVQSL